MEKIMEDELGTRIYIGSCDFWPLACTVWRLVRTWDFGAGFSVGFRNPITYS